MARWAAVDPMRRTKREATANRRDPPPWLEATQKARTTNGHGQGVRCDPRLYVPIP